MEKIVFYRVTDAFGEFSNFADFPIKLDGKIWPTSEHYFQAQKFAPDAAMERIRQANSPMLAAQMGRDRKQKLRHDWESVKVSVMKKAVRAKFEQHAELAALLVSTGQAELIEHTANDDYWGDGCNGKGQNMLGRILMEIREELSRNRPDVRS